VQRAFRRCLVCLEDVSRAFAITGPTPVAPLAVGDLHPMVMFIPRSPGSMGRYQLGFSIYMIPGNIDAEYISPEQTPAEHNEKMRTMLFRLREGDPFTLYSERTVRSLTSYTAGEFGDAVIHAAVAAEILLDGLLGLMLWEEGAAPADAAKVLAKSVSERLRSEYHGRLGGSWDQNGAGPLGAWRRDLATLRNRVVHSGYRPTEAEAGAARRAQNGIDTFIRERLVAAGVRYWRTAMMLLGIPGLTARGGWTRRVREAYENSGEDNNDWFRRYHNWRLETDPLIR
jgi:hypothetical protein